jgi:uncharacterized protein YdeI (YjbR/CyaY-like superfamily)
MPLSEPDPIYFETVAELHAWFARHHDRRTEVWLGFHRKDTGLPSIRYPDALDEALCWGWIDGIRKRWDATSYVQRFTPRTARSIWSKVNIAKVEALQGAGRMQPAGLVAFEKRTTARSGVYSFEQDKPPTLSAAREQAFRSHAKVWAWFNEQAPYYRRTALFWVESAKREETRKRRFEQLLECSRRGERLPQFSSSGTKPKR